MPSSHDNMSRLSSGWYILNVTLNHVLNGNNHLERRHRVGLGRVLLPIGIMLLFLGLLFVVPSRLSFAVYCVQIVVMVV